MYKAMVKSNVNLRQKDISNGRVTLYLDYYPPILNKDTNKYTRRELLKIYLFKKPANQIQKIANIENLRSAELIQLKRQTELSKFNVYSHFEKEQLQIQAIGEESFVKYYKETGLKKIGNNEAIWNCSFIHFCKFLKGSDLYFKDVTIILVDDYKDFLLHAKSLRNNGDTISRNTALSYHNKLKTVLKKSYKEGKLRTDINSGIEAIKEQESQRNFLTIAEAQKLFSTPCSNGIVKRIAMFSVLTGLRYSDISKLMWSEIQYIENDGYYIRFKQKKTEELQTLPISEDAYKILGAKNKDDKKVFKGLKKWDVDRVLPVWLTSSGITKHITFHCFRHTYATLQIAAGTDIYTVSKMLGHKNVKTTQIYAKILDEKKRETTFRIKL